MVRTRRRRRARGDDGFSLLETVAAITILAVGFVALATAMGTTTRLLVRAKHRQTAADIAGAHVERIRNMPYSWAALSAGLTHNPDPDHPDHAVAPDGRYDPGTGVLESVVTGGSVLHHEQVTVGSSLLQVYRYITWVNDPALPSSEDYKRLTIVVTTNDPGLPAARRQVSASAFLTEGSISLGGSTMAAGEGTAGTPSPSPSPTSGSCSGDTTPPAGTFTITSGTGATQGYTASTTVSLALSPSDPCTPIVADFSNDNSVFSGRTVYDPNNPTVTWTLQAGDGSKSVWARYADGVGNRSTKGPRTIILDQTPPTVPGTLTRTVSCSGSTRTVSLGWGTASDANLLGYRVYRSIDGGAYTLFGTYSTRSATDNHDKTLSSVRYKTVAYDHAGNEGGATNEVALSKNQCA